MSKYTCPKCKRDMQLYRFKMSSLDRCEECQLFMLDSGELDFLLGHSIEDAFFQDPKPVLQCTKCHEPLQGDSHCGERQRFECVECEKRMLKASLIVQDAYQESNSADPYRESNQTVTRYEEQSRHLHVCTHCRRLLIPQELFSRMMNTIDQ
jgi:Zn-finger nucleic acid-binding protein